MVTGFLDLAHSDSLRKKLEWEYERLADDPLNTYLAFNFFVTAWHLLEWRYPDPGGKATREALRNATPILQVCEHLAVGAKHFAPTSAKHQSVTGSKLQGGAWAPGVWAPGVWAKGVWGERMFVLLDGDAARELGAEADVMTLADKAMQFWRAH